MTPQQADIYIGNRWVKDGNGPDEWNCWNLLRHLLREYYRKEIPQVNLESGDDLRSMYEARLSSGAWIKQVNPQDGYGALLREGLHPHVGLYLDIDGGGIIHALEGFGVVFTPICNLRLLGFARVTFYEVVR